MLRVGGIARDRIAKSRDGGTPRANVRVEKHVPWLVMPRSWSLKPKLGVAKGLLQERPLQFQHGNVRVTSRILHELLA